MAAWPWSPAGQRCHRRRSLRRCISSRCPDAFRRRRAGSVSSLRLSATGYRGAESSALQLPTSSCSTITDERLAALAHDSKRIRILNLGYCTQITDAGLKHLSALAELTHLEMRCLVRITGIGITSIAIDCTSLIELDLKLCYSVGSWHFQDTPKISDNLPYRTAKSLIWAYFICWAP